MYLPFNEPVSYQTWCKRNGTSDPWEENSRKWWRRIDRHANPHPDDYAGSIRAALYPGRHALKTRGHKPRYKDHRRK